MIPVIASATAFTVKVRHEIVVIYACLYRVLKIIIHCFWHIICLVALIASGYFINMIFKAARQDAQFSAPAFCAALGTVSHAYFTSA